MTSGIDELEALLAALRLSFLTSSSATSSPEALRQSIAVFRAALRPQGVVLTSPPPNVAYKQKPDDGNHHDFVTAGEPTSATSTMCGNEDRIDVVSQLTKRMDLVNAELRQGNDHIRELVQSVEELKKEVRDLRSAVVPPKSLASTEDHPPPSPPAIDAVQKGAILTPVNEAQVEPSPSPYAVEGSRSTPSMPTCLQPIPEVTTSSSIPSLISLARSFIPPNLPPPRVAPQLVSGATPMTSARSPHAAEATELAALLRPVATPTPAQTINTVPINPPYSSRQPSLVPVPVNPPEAIPVSPESPKPALSDIEPKDCTDQTGPRLTGKEGVTRTDECETHAPNDEGKMKAEDAGGQEDSVTPESRPKSPVIATAIRYFCSGEKGDLMLDEDDKIRILDNATTPQAVGCLYGEIVETRRGIFPARCVWDELCLDAEDELNSDHIYDNSETVEPDSKLLIITTAIESYEPGFAPADELTFKLGDRIHVLDFPDTPIGWMYAKTRRGIFPARFVTLE